MSLTNIGSDLGLSTLNPLSGGSYQPSQNFSPQYTSFNIPVISGAYVTPYSTNLKVLTGANFTLSDRDKISLKDDSSGINYIILFYREGGRDSNDLNAVQKLFVDISKTTVPNVEYRICNISSDSELTKAFNYFNDHPEHPFSWVASAKNPNIFILIYNSGYPQMFYEGPLTLTFLNDFALGLKQSNSSKVLFTKFGTMNGYDNVNGVGQTYREQAWTKFKTNPEIVVFLVPFILNVS
jgi:hypothetical protein